MSKKTTFKNQSELNTLVKTLDPNITTDRLYNRAVCDYIYILGNVLLRSKEQEEYSLEQIAELLSFVSDDNGKDYFYELDKLYSKPLYTKDDIERYLNFKKEAKCVYKAVGITVAINIQKHLK